MKTRILIAALFLTTWIGTARAQTAQCPPLSPNSGITASVMPPIANTNPAGCDTGFIVNTAMTILQGPVNRHFFKITNASASTGPNLGICFARLEMGPSFTCTMANAGTVLAPGQSFYQGVAMYGGVLPFNSIFFSDSIELVGSGIGVTVAVTID